VCRGQPNGKRQLLVNRPEEFQPRAGAADSCDQGVNLARQVAKVAECAAMKMRKHRGRGTDTVPAPAFQLSLLGDFELSGPDGRIELTSKKQAALLAFLACTAPQAHSRDKLMTLLWGSHFDAQARQNLRQALFRLRRVLGEDALISSGESISLQPGAVACDVARFEALLVDGIRDALDAAVGLYMGRLLADFAIRD